MNRVGAKSCLIPEKNLATRGFRRAGDGRKRLASPRIDRLRITLIARCKGFCGVNPNLASKAQWHSDRG